MNLCLVPFASQLLLLSTAILLPIIVTPYGLDVSWPIHDKEAFLQQENATLDHDDDGGELYNFGQDRVKAYQEYMKRCTEASKSCFRSETAVMRNNINTPMTIRNYTDLGFKKVRAPEGLYAPLKEFWDANRQGCQPIKIHSTLYNVFEGTTKICDIKSKKIISSLMEEAKTPLEEWSGQKLDPGLANGIRVYTEGALLVPHVDATPMIISAIVIVDQDVDSFPLEVYSHDGVAYNITTEPGDMIMYESASVVHGRPFPMQGRFMANALLHFEPTDKSWHTGQFGSPMKYKVDPFIATKTQLRRRGNAGVQHHAIHQAAKIGDLATVQQGVENDRTLLQHHSADGTLLHESAHAGHAGIVKYLSEAGADVNIKSRNGATPMHLALVENNHEVVSYLESLGALDVGPDL